ncbi:MAG: type II toxin-antitoxin system VapC family toxin, partial [Methanobacteriaceae archaeon]
MIFVDSSFLIALINNNDQWHSNAIKIAPEVKKTEKIVSNIIIIETLNLLGSLGGKVGRDIYETINDNYVIYMENKAIYDKAITTFIHYDGTIGYADCVNIEIMKELGISKIASFD